jgi:hypothetical protein
MASVVDLLASQDPHRVVCKSPSIEEGSAEFSSLLMSDLSQAVNGAAWLIERLLGRAHDNGSLMYIGRNDERYLVVMLACEKTGWLVREITPVSVVVD